MTRWSTRSTASAWRSATSPTSAGCPASSRLESYASSGIPTRPRSSVSGSTPATASSITCGAARRTSLPVTSFRWPPSARPCPTVARSASRGILGIDPTACSARPRELGLGGDHSGILILPPDVPLGVPYGEVTGLVDDVVFDVDVTRNRPDAFGHVGVARDLAAKLGLAVHAAAAGRCPRRRPPPAPVEILAGDRCGRFTLTVLSGRRGRSRARPGWPPGCRRGTAPDQQRRRREQLRDARAQPAQPRLRPRHARGRRASGCASPTTASS